MKPPFATFYSGKLRPLPGQHPENLGSVSECLTVEYSAQKLSPNKPKITSDRRCPRPKSQMNDTAYVVISQQIHSTPI